MAEVSLALRQFTGQIPPAAGSANGKLPRIVTPEQKTISKKKFYVYALCFPDGKPFYIGKGSGNRIFEHEKEARSPALSPAPRHLAIRQIWQDGDQIERLIVFETDDNTEALEMEAQIIRRFTLEDLTNQTEGGVRSVKFLCEFRRNFTVRINMTDLRLKNLVEKLGITDLRALSPEAVVNQVIENYLTS